MYSRLVSFLSQHLFDKLVPHTISPPPGTQTSQILIPDKTQQFTPQTRTSFEQYFLIPFFPASWSSAFLSADTSSSFLINNRTSSVNWVVQSQPKYLFIFPWKFCKFMPMASDKPGKQSFRETLYGAVTFPPDQMRISSYGCQGTLEHISFMFQDFKLNRYLNYL